MAIICDKDMVEGVSISDILQEKRKEAADHLDRTGSLPDWWELGIRLSVPKATQKFASPEEYFTHGMAYFQRVAEQSVANEDPALRPTLSGLILWMGFTCRSGFEMHVRRNPEFRNAHATFMTLLNAPLEGALSRPGVNTAGISFLLKNLPEGFLPTDDINVSARHNWKDRRQTEITGEGGGPLVVQTSERTPEEVYMDMLKRGARLQEKVPGEGEETSLGEETSIEPS